MVRRMLLSFVWVGVFFTFLFILSGCGDALDILNSNQINSGITNNNTNSNNNYNDNTDNDNENGNNSSNSSNNSGNVGNDNSDKGNGENTGNGNTGNGNIDNGNDNNNVDGDNTDKGNIDGGNTDTDNGNDENTGNDNNSNTDNSGSENTGGNDTDNNTGNNNSENNNGDKENTDNGDIGNADSGNENTDGDNTGNENNTENSDIKISFECDINELDIVCFPIIENVPDNVDIVDYLWEFGDGSGANGYYDGYHKYRRSGEYAVTLRVKYNSEILNDVTKNIGTKKYNIVQTSFPNLFSNTFGHETNRMYFALHITGKSFKGGADNTGLFAQKGYGFTNEWEEDFAKDLFFMLTEIPGEERSGYVEFSKYYNSMGLSGLYSTAYGWTDADGLTFDMPFYFGYQPFNIPISSNGKVVFRVFDIIDMQRSMLMPGYDYPVFVRCNKDMFNFQIPMNEYNASIHKNIALLTVEFTEACTYTVKFDGFVSK